MDESTLLKYFWTFLIRLIESAVSRVIANEPDCGRFGQKKQDNSLESFKVNKDGPKSLQVSATRPEEYRVGITDWQPKYSPRRWIPFEKLFEIVQNCLLVTTKAAENGALRVWQLPGELGGTGSALSRTLMIENEQSVSCSLKKSFAYHSNRPNSFTQHRFRSGGSRIARPPNRVEWITWFVCQRCGSPKFQIHHVNG